MTNTDILLTPLPPHTTPTHKSNIIDKLNNKNQWCGHRDIARITKMEKEEKEEKKHIKMKIS